ncbi:MAG: tRNA (cytosine(32)/uridine(32)-2'-O)-methyltransferase TrmJ [Candidatus Symbiodolus clandestinus]
MLSSIRIILVEPSHPGNIGAAARAMKTMGLQSLYLIKPRSLPDVQSVAMAAGAQDVLSAVNIQPSLLPAIADCGLVIGLSARPRTLQWPLLTPRRAATLAIQEIASHPVAFLLGNEQNGLSNVDCQHCHYQLTIPANPSYSSLNIAMALQIISYELYLAQQEQRVIDTTAVVGSVRYPEISDIEQLYKHLERVLRQIGFIRPQGSEQVVSRLRWLLTRARLQDTEVNLLRGILTMVEKKSGE